MSLFKFFTVLEDGEYKCSITLTEYDRRYTVLSVHTQNQDLLAQFIDRNMVLMLNKTSAHLLIPSQEALKNVSFMLNTADFGETVKVGCSETHLSLSREAEALLDNQWRRLIWLLDQSHVSRRWTNMAAQIMCTVFLQHPVRGVEARQLCRDPDRLALDSAMHDTLEIFDSSFKSSEH
jgi:hypothetical protein